MDFGKETRLAMKPIKQKKRRYYAIVFLLVIAIVGGMVGYVKYNQYKRDKGFNDAMALMGAGLDKGDYASLSAAEKAIAVEAARNNPRVEAVAHTVLLRALLWKMFTGEAVLLSECRKFVAFLREPLVDDTGKEFDSPYKDEPMTAVADAVVKAINPVEDGDIEAARAFLNGMDASMLPPGEKEYWLAITHWSAGEWVPAEAMMKRAVGAADTPHHRFGLARVLQMGGKQAEAIEEYNKVLGANPDHLAAQAYLLLLQLDPAQDMAAPIEEFFTSHAGTVPARIASDLTLVMAHTYCLKGEEDRARRVIQQAKINDPGYKLLLDWQPPAPPEPEEEKK
jgi:tetratricopeptide (TPR) repeat protein